MSVRFAVLQRLFPFFRQTDAGHGRDFGHTRDYSEEIAAKVDAEVNNGRGYADFVVSMGQYAVPFIKDELIRKPSTLVWALNYIYGYKISSNPHLTISEACKLWIKKI